MERDTRISCRQQENNKQNDHHETKSAQKLSECDSLVDSLDDEPGFAELKNESMNESTTVFMNAPMPTRQARTTAVMNTPRCGQPGGPG